MMKPNRVKWKVRLMRSNYKATEGQMIPRVHLYGSLSMNEVIDRIVQDPVSGLCPVGAAGSCAQDADRNHSQKQCFYFSHKLIFLHLINMIMLLLSAHFS